MDSTGSGLLTYLLIEIFDLLLTLLHSSLKLLFDSILALLRLKSINLSGLSETSVKTNDNRTKKIGSRCEIAKINCPWTLKS